MVLASQSPPDFVRLAAHPLRWRLLTALAGGDHRVRELVELAGRPQNLVSYHLRLLRGGGLVTARRSSFDGRDLYYHLDLERCAQALSAAGAALHTALGLDRPSPPAAVPRLAVLFACTGNSTRSPIAEALLRQHTGGRVEVTSAGSHPGERMHPGAVRVLRDDFGIDIADRRPRSLDMMTARRFDYVISLCDRVREVCPGFPGRPSLIHWSIPDPATSGGVGNPTFGGVAAEIDTRIRHLLPLLTSHDSPKRQEAPS